MNKNNPLVGFPLTMKSPSSDVNSMEKADKHKEK